MKGYVDNKVTTANIGQIGYTDSKVTIANTIQKAYTDGQVVAVNTATTLSNTIQVAAIIAANVGMRGYVDQQKDASIYGNANVTSFLPTYAGTIATVTTANTIVTAGIVTANIGLKGYTDFANTVQDGVITNKVNTANERVCR